jgi:Fic family protein
MPQKPPYTITEKAADYLAKIVETITRLDLGTDFKRDSKLHRENRVRTIHSSLAIEGNTLSLDDVTAVIEGKLVAGKQADVKEVKNAYATYDQIMTFDPYSIADFLKAYGLMTQGVVRESGKFRSGDVGVFDGDRPIHIGARPQFVPQLIGDLFAWAKDSTLHPVLKSAILHYEIEIIHPFEDGNGRVGRLWQTLLLARWNSIFAWVPMESALYQNRPQYYKAIEEARHADDSGAFIEFTLCAIYETIVLQGRQQGQRGGKHQEKHQVEALSALQISVLKALGDATLSRKELLTAIGTNGDSRWFKRHIEPLIHAGFMERTVPEKPNSRLQKYRITEDGKRKSEE